MREIKFRAWDKKWKVMVGATGKVIDCFSMRSDGMIPDNYELMQYTGLHDKNGKEIYEGDRVIFDDFG